MIIKSVSAKSIYDSKKEKTISVTINTNVGDFSASAPNGKSTGKNESKPYKKNLDGDIKTLKDFTDYFSDEVIENLEDIRRVEDVTEGHIGANSLFALESAVLKALAKKKNKKVWEVINPKAKKIHRLVGNSAEGGKHSITSIDMRKPDFQEFLLITLSVGKKAVEENKKFKKIIEVELKINDKKFSGKTTYENAWQTSLNEKQVFDILRKTGLPIGVDIAASSFYKRGKYYYKNPLLKRTVEEQENYLANLIKNFDLFYIEDPFYEEDFSAFSRLLKKFPEKLIVGDDLTVTSVKRLEKAIKMKSINGIIVKPNQCGSLLEVKEVCELAKKNKIKIIFSHRSGETKESILADLAVGFGADFLKCGIDGPGRDVKLKRLMEIEKEI